MVYWSVLFLQYHPGRSADEAQEAMKDSRETCFKWYRPRFDNSEEALEELPRTGLISPQKMTARNQKLWVWNGLTVYDLAATIHSRIHC